MDIVELLKNFYELEKCENLDDSWTYSVETPMHKFEHLVFRISGGYFVSVTQRDKLDFNSMISLRKFIMDRMKLDEFNQKRKIQLFDGLHLDRYEFDTVAIITPDCHDIFRHECSELHQKTFVAFPIFHSEFVGNESSDTIKLIRRDLVDSINWERDISPRIYLSFQNVTTGVKSKKKPAMANMEELTGVLNSFQDCEGYIELRNYREQTCRVDISNNNITVSGDFVSDEKSLSGLKDTLKGFLLK